MLTLEEYLKTVTLDWDPLTELKNCEVTAIIYTRFSSHSQREVSIDQQIKVCLEYARRHGIRIMRIYADKAISGTTDKRPEFQKMVRDSRHGTWDQVIVYAFDRFARNRYDSAIYKKQLGDAGVRVFSATETLSDDPAGALMESLLEGMAEYYSRELSAKVRRGHADNAAKCMVNGMLPFGYKKSPEGKYAIHDAESAAVLEAFTRVANLEQHSEIMADFNRRGIKTRQNKPWTRSSFYHMLTNERYKGIYIYNDIRVPGGIPRIISDDLFDAVETILRVKPNPRKSVTGAPKRRRRDNSVYLLTGKLFCGKCKGPMIGVSGTSRTSDLHHYYTCKTKRDTKSCDKKSVRRDYIEALIAQTIKASVLNESVMNQIADLVMEMQNQSSAVVEYEGVAQQKKATQSEIDNIVKAIKAGVYSESLTAELNRLEGERKFLEARENELQVEMQNLLTRDQIMAVLQMYKHGDVNDPFVQANLIDVFLVAAYLYDKKIKIIFHVDGKTDEIEIPFDIDEVFSGDSSVELDGSYKRKSLGPKSA